MKEFPKTFSYCKERKLLNKKIESDRTLEKYANELNKAIIFNQKHREDVIIGTCLIIRNNQEIYFLIDGYLEENRLIHSTHILKWAIIKKYFNAGYHIFNLGKKRIINITVNTYTKLVLVVISLNTLQICY